MTEMQPEGTPKLAGVRLTLLGIAVILALAVVGVVQSIGFGAGGYAIVALLCASGLCIIAAAVLGVLSKDS